MKAVFLFFVLTNICLAQLLPWRTLLNNGIGTIEAEPISKTLYVARSNQLIRITNNGNTFDTINVETFACVLALGQGLLYAGDDGNLGIFKSTDNGESWTSIFPFWRITDIFYDGSRLWATNENGVLLFSDDMGDTWETNSFNLNRQIISLCSDSPYVFLGLSYGEGYYYSNNYGNDWHKYDELQGPGYICQDSDSGLFLITYDSLLYSSDHGNSWEQRSSLTAFTRYLAIDSYDNLYYSDINYGLFKSTDDGTSWNKISTFNPSRIEFIDSSIYMTNNLKLLAYIPGFINQAGTNMFPLSRNNKYQYLVHQTWDGFDGYDLEQREIIKDTTMSGYKYYLFNNCGDYFRYQKDSNLAYLRYGDAEGVYADFNLYGGVTFMQLTPGSHTYREVTVEADSGLYFGVMKKIFKWWYYYDYTHIDQSFAENLGIIRENYNTSHPMGGGQTSWKLIGAIIKDTSGNNDFYFDGYKPEIIFEPFYSLDLTPVKLFSSEINHEYNHKNYQLGTVTDGIIYIDSAYVEYFYKKDTVATSKQIEMGTRTPLTYNYNFSLPIDTVLIQNGYELYYRIIASDKSLVPQFSFSPDSGYYVAEYNPVAISENQNSRLSYMLEQNYPNPFNPNTTIGFSIPKESHINLSIYNLLGERVVVLKNEVMLPGYYQVEFDAIHLVSGIYFYRIKAGDFIQTKKMLLLK